MMWPVPVKERQVLPSFEVCGTRDHLDPFPQSIVNSSSTIYVQAIIKKIKNLKKE